MSRVDNKKLRNNSSVEAVGTILNKVLKDLDKDKRIKEYSIFLIWNDVVGRKFAKNSEPKSIQRGLLKVIVTNSVWIQQFLFLKEELINKLNNKLKGEIVKDIIFEIGIIEKKSSKYSKQEDIINLDKVILSQSEINEIEETISIINDINLKNLMKEVLIKAKKRKILERKGVINGYFNKI